jgi:hypothetical protein
MSVTDKTWIRWASIVAVVAFVIGGGWTSLTVIAKVVQGYDDVEDALSDHGRKLDYIGHEISTILTTQKNNDTFGQEWIEQLREQNKNITVPYLARPPAEQSDGDPQADKQ